MTRLRPGSTSGVERHCGRRIRVYLTPRRRWLRKKDLHLRPKDYESLALLAELFRQFRPCFSPRAAITPGRSTGVKQGRSGYHVRTWEGQRRSFCYARHRFVPAYEAFEQYAGAIGVIHVHCRGRARRVDQCLSFLREECRCRVLVFWVQVVLLCGSIAITHGVAGPETPRPEIGGSKPPHAGEGRCETSRSVKSPSRRLSLRCARRLVAGCAAPRSRRVCARPRIARSAPQRLDLAYS